MAPILEEGSSSNDTKADALAGLPLAHLSREDRIAAEAVLSSVGLFRRLPTIAFDCDPAVYDYFIRRPDAAVNIWRVLEISEFRMQQTGRDRFQANAGDGTVGTVRLLHRGKGELLVLCTGAFKNPLLLRPISAQALLHLETKLVKQADGKPRAVHRLNMFVSFPSQTVETAAKVLSPVSNMILDRNFREVSLFVHMMSTAMTRQPTWVEQLAHRLTDVPESRRRELVEITSRVYTTEGKRIEALKRKRFEGTATRSAHRQPSGGALRRR